jgi:drug/metabolite transporter (DMT)-like permease
MSLRAAWAGLPGSLRGAVWMLLAALAMSVQSAAVKSLGTSISSVQITFLRCLLGLFLVLPLLRRDALVILQPARLRLHLGRVMAGLLSMTCGFYAFANMPLAEATALSFTMPLFMLLLATLTLGERVGWRRSCAGAVGFLGVLTMLRPGAVPVDLAAGLALLGALFHALAGIFIKKLTASESTALIMFYFAAIGSLLYLLPTLGVWVHPNPAQWWLLLVVAVLGVISQLGFIAAARAAEMSAIVPIDYTRLIFSGALGYLVWSEIPDRWSVAGAGLIVASTCFITYREMRLARMARRG